MILGSDAWKNGLENNRHVLYKFLSFAYDMGVSERKMTAEELFDPSSWTIAG
jgi:hypothetical protein